MTDKKTNPIDLELYETYLPAFQRGLLAKDALAGDDDLTRADKIRLRTQVSDGERAFEVMSDRFTWLVRRIVREELHRPRSFHVVLDEDDLMQAGFEGVFKMLRKTDLSKMKSGTNYLMNWVKTSVERSAAKAEAVYGLPPSRLRVFKKISAVRAKLAADMGRQPTDEEVLEFFHSGAADWKSYYGHTGSNSKSFKENARISLGTVTEQGIMNRLPSMRVPVTDEHTIDSMVSIPAAADSVLDSSPRGFWEAFFAMERIDPAQWPVIADGLDLYDVDDEAHATGRRQLADDFKRFLGDHADDIAALASDWTVGHGDGPWSVFIGMPRRPSTEAYKRLRFMEEQ